MSRYLSAALASNRKGRFLQTVAGATPISANLRVVVLRLI